jgi:hypothetical protein
MRANGLTPVRAGHPSPERADLPNGYRTMSLSDLPERLAELWRGGWTSVKLLEDA